MLKGGLILRRDHRYHTISLFDRWAAYRLSRLPSVPSQGTAQGAACRACAVPCRMCRWSTLRQAGEISRSDQGNQMDRNLPGFNPDLFTDTLKLFQFKSSPACYQGIGSPGGD